MNLKIKLKNPEYCGEPYGERCPFLINSTKTFSGFMCKLGYRKDDIFAVYYMELATKRKKDGTVIKIIRPLKCKEEKGE